MRVWTGALFVAIHRVEASTASGQDAAHQARRDAVGRIKEFTGAYRDRSALAAEYRSNDRLGSIGLALHRPAFMMKRHAIGADRRLVRVILYKPEKDRSHMHATPGYFRGE